MIHREPLVKPHEILLKHCETLEHSSFDATISALDVETLALDAETSALGSATHTHLRSWYNSADV